MDPKADTFQHILNVSTILNGFISKLLERQTNHDLSKLQDPEWPIFEKVTPQLAELTYGSPEYKKALEEMGPALEHHYANNRHHPEFHKAGIDGMNLFDILEMLADWKAATLRHNDGDILKSIAINKGRFGMSDQLTRILLNTIRDMDMEGNPNVEEDEKENGN